MHTIVKAATDQTQEISAIEWTQKIDKYIRRMKRKSPLFKEHLKVVYSGLRDLQAKNVGQPVMCGELTADSAHLLIALACKRMEEGWRSCKDISVKSKTDPRYIRQAEPYDEVDPIV
jgi:hypothetical protein